MMQASRAGVSDPVSQFWEPQKLVFGAGEPVIHGYINARHSVFHGKLCPKSPQIGRNIDRVHDKSMSLIPELKDNCDVIHPNFIFVNAKTSVCVTGDARQKTTEIGS